MTIGSCSSLADLIQTEAALARRPDQRDRLLAIAAQVRKLESMRVARLSAIAASGPLADSAYTRRLREAFGEDCLD